MSTFEGLVWTCHVCGRTRPDALISVRKFVVNGLVTINVRYCNDTPSCFEGAERSDLVRNAMIAFGHDAEVSEA